MRAMLALYLLLTSAALAIADPPKPIADAIKQLERAAATSKDATEKEQILDAVTALRKIAEQPKIQNHLLSDFADNPKDFAGRTITFRLTYDAAGVLNKRISLKGVPFKGRDAKNGAKVSLGMDFPQGLTLPAVQEGDELVITFVAGVGGQPHVATKVSRP